LRCVLYCTYPPSVVFQTNQTDIRTKLAAIDPAVFQTNNTEQSALVMTVQCVIDTYDPPLPPNLFDLAAELSTEPIPLPQEAGKRGGRESPWRREGLSALRPYASLILRLHITGPTIQRRKKRKKKSMALIRAFGYQQASLHRTPIKTKVCSLHTEDTTHTPVLIYTTTL
jgi:hypothetical protein